MKRSQLIKKIFPYGLSGTGLAIGLCNTLAACRRVGVATGSDPAIDSAAKLPLPPASPAPQTKAPQTSAKAVWRVAIAPEFEPFAMTESGRLVGFDVDLIRAVGKVCDVQIRLDAQPFDALIPLIQANQADIALGAVPITAKRTKHINFSQPYFRSGIAIAALPQNAQLITLSALSNQTIAIQLETAGARLAVDIPGSKILIFEQASDAIAAVEQGSAKAALVALPTLLTTLANQKELSVQTTGALIEAHNFGIMVRRSASTKATDRARLQAINTALNTLVEDGTYAQIYARWLRTTPPETPLPIESQPPS